MSASEGDTQKVKRGPNWVDTEQPDGTHIVEVHAGPLNYLSNGKYVPIDPTIKSDGEGHFVEKGVYKARWKKDSSVRIEKDRYYVSYTEKHIKIGNKKIPIKKLTKKKNKNKLTYTHVTSTVDIEYDYLPAVLKQAYVLKTPLSTTGEEVTFYSTLHFSPGLEVNVEGNIKDGAFETDKGIELKDGNGDDFVFRILPPVIYDSNGERIRGSYSVVRKGNHLDLTLNVPMEWLSDSSRKYPVYVDPAVQATLSGDAEVWQADPDWEWDVSSTFQVITQPFTDTGGDIYGLLKYDLPTHIPGGNVFNAMFDLYKTDYNNLYTNTRINIHEAESDDWDETTVTWNNYGGYKSTVLAYKNPISGTGHKYFWGTTYSNLKKAVINNLHGDDVISFVIKDSTNNAASRKKQKFAAGSYSTSSYRPKLYIYYDNDGDPDSVIVSPTPKEGSTQTTDFSVYVTDIDEYLKKCEYRVVSNGVQTRGWTTRTCDSSVTITVGPSKDCPHEGTNICAVYVRATDKVGNVGSDDRYFSIGLNDKPNAAFTVDPPSGDTSTSFSVDASGSSDPEDPKSSLQVRWDWENDGVYDTSWTTTKTASHTYTTPGTYTIKLQVRDTGGLESDPVTHTVSVGQVNQKPNADFKVTPTFGDKYTNFNVDASDSYDQEDPKSSLQVRWDWENDGTWDTGWTTTKTASHKYNTEGTYTIKLQVEDTNGAKGTTTRDIDVIGWWPEPTSDLIVTYPSLVEAQVKQTFSWTPNNLEVLKGIDADFQWELRRPDTPNAWDFWIPNTVTLPLFGEVPAPGCHFNAYTYSDLPGNPTFKYSEEYNVITNCPWESITWEGLAGNEEFEVKARETELLQPNTPYIVRVSFDRIYRFGTMEIESSSEYCGDFLSEKSCGWTPVSGPWHQPKAKGYIKFGEHSMTVKNVNR